MLAALPLPNRAASSLAALAPGVVMIDTGAGTAENYPVFTVAGGRPRNQNLPARRRQRDQRRRPHAPAAADQPAGGRDAGVQGHHQQLLGGVRPLHRRRRDACPRAPAPTSFRGSVFESLRNDALDARNFFAQSKPPISLNQFGGTFGGPAVRDRTFFFGTWERTRQLVSNAVVSTVPTLAEPARRLLRPAHQRRPADSDLRPRHAAAVSRAT